jgi:hypothetical protein
VELFPGEKVHLTDLSREEAVQGADVYLIGFGVNRGNIPIKVMDALDAAEGKTILLFVTCGVEPTEDYRTAIERKITPFLPDNCDYKGLFLCAAQLPDEVIQNIQEALRRQPDNAQALSLLEHHKKTRGHPDNNDVEQLYAFIRQKLKE